MNRQEYWLSKGITKESIENHLRWERKKSKESRDLRKKNNQPNKELIKQIQSDLLKQTFKLGNITIKILSINPSVDGKGFWFKYNKTFTDGSNGDFRQFSYFEEYNKDDFIKYLSL